MGEERGTEHGRLLCEVTLPWVRGLHTITVKVDPFSQVVAIDVRDRVHRECRLEISWLIGMDLVARDDERQQEYE